MGWITKFFGWLWESIKNTVSYLSTIFSQLTVAFTTIFTSVYALKQTVTSGSPVMDSTNALGQQAISSISSLFSGQHDLLRVASYSLAFDTLFSLSVSYLTIIITISLALILFFIIAVPAWIVNLYLIKSTAWLLTYILPEGWIPKGISNFASFKTSFITAISKSLPKEII